MVKHVHRNTSLGNFKVASQSYSPAHYRTTTKHLLGIERQCVVWGHSETQGGYPAIPNSGLAIDSWPSCRSAGSMLVNIFLSIFCATAEPLLDATPLDRQYFYLALRNVLPTHVPPLLKLKFQGMRACDWHTTGKFRRNRARHHIAHFWHEDGSRLSGDDFVKKAFFLALSVRRELNHRAQDSPLGFQQCAKIICRSCWLLRPDRTLGSNYGK